MPTGAALDDRAGRDADRRGALVGWWSRVTAPLSGEQLVAWVYRWRRKTTVIIDRFEPLLPVIRQVDPDLMPLAKSVLENLDLLRIALGTVADFYGRGVSRARRGGAS